MNAINNFISEARWPTGRASDSGAKGGGFDPHSGVVSLSKIHLPPKKVLVIPTKRWLRHDMTEPEDQWSCERSPDILAY